jgi:hypothetical protein
MDDRRFDNLARAAAATPSRRALVQTLLGGAGGLFAAVGLSGITEAASCKNDGDCGGCQTCQRKKGKKKGKCKTGCPRGRRCCGGACVKPDECCTISQDCGACASCADGRCRSDAGKNGQQCSGCLTCINGACGLPDDNLCPSGERCRNSTGLCCLKCLSDDRCCQVGHACIDPGALSANFCCDTANNTPCGSNGDGTFAACCSNFNETCDANECKPKSECPPRRLSTEGICCPHGPACGGVCCGEDEECCGGDCTKNMKLCPGETRPYCATLDRECCGDYTCDVGEECCNPHGNICCAPGRCVGPQCCPGDQVICGDECCDFGQKCCGGVCCSVFDCIDDVCCEEGACGDVGASTRVCPTATETCCLTDDPDPEIGNRGYACPASTPVCANRGQCCPEFHLYRQSCGACCPDIRNCDNCVGAIDGRI